MGIGLYREGRFWLVVLLLLVVPIRNAASADITPEQVKASYLLQLRKFVQAGAPPHALNTVCYYEKPGVPADESVGQILKKYVLVQHVDQINVKWVQAARDFSGCDMLYIPTEEEGSIDDILSKLGSSSTLTVSDAKRFIVHGGMVGFVVDDANRIRLEGNLKNMSSNNVMADAQLLEIMQQVVRH